MGGARRVSLQLPPNLEEPPRERALQGPVFLLLPQAMDRLHQLCSVEDLRLGKVVGRGGTSCVRWTERTGTQEKYATKVFNTLHPEHCKLLSAELRVLLELDCPCVVKFYGAWVDENYINLALEAMFLGSLFDMIYVRGNPCFSRPPGVLRWRNRSAGGASQQHGQRDERAVLAVAFQILWGLKYLHSKGIAHRDVKPSNVLADTSGSVKLADFGTALFLKEKTNDVMGTFRYMPPESAPRKPGDVWAAGLVVAEVFAHDLPFKACDSHVELAQLLDESDDDTILEHVLPKKNRAPDSITRLVRECLTFNSEDRPSAAQLLLSDTFSGIGIRTPEQARKAVREWLYHDDHQPSHAGAVSPALQERRHLAAAAEARAAFGANDRETYDAGGLNSHNGDVDQLAVLRRLTAASHGSRENSDGNDHSNSERAAERFSESNSGRSSDLSSRRSCKQKNSGFSSLTESPSSQQQQQQQQQQRWSPLSRLLPRSKRFPASPPPSSSSEATGFSSSPVSSASSPKPRTRRSSGATASLTPPRDRSIGSRRSSAGTGGGGGGGDGGPLDRDGWFSQHNKGPTSKQLFADGQEEEEQERKEAGGEEEGCVGHARRGDPSRGRGRGSFWGAR